MRRKDFSGIKTLVAGDVNTGKTTFYRRLLHLIIGEGWAPRTAGLDLAPSIPAKTKMHQSVKGVGGSLKPCDDRILYLHPVLAPPRLASKTEEEAFLKAEENLREIRKAVAIIASSSRDVLFVNDVTLALQAGTARDVLQWMSAFPTVVANGYYGEKLGTGEFSRRERRRMEELMKELDRVLLPPFERESAFRPSRKQSSG